MDPESLKKNIGTMLTLTLLLLMVALKLPPGAQQEFRQFLWALDGSIIVLLVSPFISN